MPLYPFKCDHCDHGEEIICKIADKDNHKSCPKCGKEWRQVMCAPGMTIIHDMQGKADLFHKRVNIGGKAFNTTDGMNSRYYFKNNPEENPLLLKRKMESSAENKGKNGKSS